MCSVWIDAYRFCGSKLVKYTQRWRQPLFRASKSSESAEALYREAVLMAMQIVPMSVLLTVQIVGMLSVRGMHARARLFYGYLYLDPDAPAAAVAGQALTKYRPPWTGSSAKQPYIV